MKRIKYCISCKEYTLKDKCPKCGNNTILNVPPKFSIEDKYAKYRRQENNLSDKDVDK
ncbi:MAG: nucleolar RNA-binding Nop10p family protein [Candidatus Nanoarchaeia archaeon]|nr:nucleolar RNA-binding Nop10p family protein [Candidatus Nanoarchaeia archaeon]